MQGVNVMDIFWREIERRKRQPRPGRLVVKLAAVGFLVEEHGSNNNNDNGNSNDDMHGYYYYGERIKRKKKKKPAFPFVWPTFSGFILLKSARVIQGINAIST